MQLIFSPGEAVKNGVLEPGFRATDQSPQRPKGTVGKEKKTPEPDLGRFNRGVNRPQPGSWCFFVFP